MKKICVCLIMLTVILTSCVAASPKDPLGYQSRPATVKAKLTSDTGEFSLEIELYGFNGETGARDAVIRVTSPESIAGLTVTVTGGVVTMSSGTLVIPVSADAAKRWLDVTGLFALDNSMISSVTENGGSVTVGVSRGEGAGVYVTFEGGSELPSEIRTSDDALRLRIESYVYNDNGIGDSNDESSE